MSESTGDGSKSYWTQPSTWRQLPSIVIGGAMGLVFAYLMDPHSAAFLSSNPSSPPGAVRMALIAMLLGVYSFGIGVYVRYKLAKAPAAQSTGGRPRLRRNPAKKPGRQFLAWNGVLVAWLFLLSTNAHWTYSTVGFESDWHPALAMLVGLVAYGVFWLLLMGFAKAAGVGERLIDHHLQNMALLIPRRTADKRAFAFGVCVLNPLIEELIFRGILVFQLGYAIQSTYAALVVGLVVSLGNHAYQGWWSTTTHLPFYLIAVALLYSPAGLWGAVGCHVAGDFVPMATMRAKLKAFREIHRRSGRPPALPLAEELE